MQIEQKQGILELIEIVETLRYIESRIIEILPMIGDNAWSDLDGAKVGNIHDNFSQVFKLLYNELDTAEGR